MKVNSFNIFMSIVNLLKKDSVVYNNWEVFSRKFIEMVKWFYLVYLNYDVLDKIPPIIRVIELNLLNLHKIMDSLGGYVAITLSDKWKTIAKLQGLTSEEGSAVQDCYMKFIDWIMVYLHKYPGQRSQKKKWEKAVGLQKIEAHKACRMEHKNQE